MREVHKYLRRSMMQIKIENVIIAAINRAETGSVKFAILIYGKTLHTADVLLTKHDHVLLRWTRAEPPYYQTPTLITPA